MVFQTEVYGSVLFPSVSLAHNLAEARNVSLSNSATMFAEADILYKYSPYLPSIDQQRRCFIKIKNLRELINPGRPKSTERLYDAGEEYYAPAMLRSIVLQLIAVQYPCNYTLNMDG